MSAFRNPYGIAVVRISRCVRLFGKEDGNRVKRVLVVVTSDFRTDLTGQKGPWQRDPCPGFAGIPAPAGPTSR